MTRSIVLPFVERLRWWKSKQRHLEVEEKPRAQLSYTWFHLMRAQRRQPACRQSGLCAQYKYFDLHNLLWHQSRIPFRRHRQWHFRWHSFTAGWLRPSASVTVVTARPSSGWNAVTHVSGWDLWYPLSTLDRGPVYLIYFVSIGNCKALAPTQFVITDDSSGFHLNVTRCSRSDAGLLL